MNDTQILRSLMESMQKTSQPKTSPYDTTAEVRRIEDGVAWVHIAGGVDETPVRLTINAKEGDNVQVRVSGGTAFLVGNGTAPPTDDTRANIAQNTATNAQNAADTAIQDAERAKEAADSAQASADSAAASAASAQVSANNANEYASRALGGLSTVQSVAETLNWITQHGTMTLTTDTALDPTHVYFVQDSEGDYVVGNTHYSIVTEPSADDLSTYYVLSIDESLQNYVGTHLAVTGEGLWVLPAASGYKVLIATGQGTQYTTAGTYIIDASGNTVAKFGQTTRIGKTNAENITIGSEKIDFNAVDGSLAARFWFNKHTYQALSKYGLRLSNEANSSFILFDPVVDVNTGFTGLNRLVLGIHELLMHFTGLKHIYTTQSHALFVLNDTNECFTVDWDGNVAIALDTSASSGTDHDLYAAITALGWGSEVIV